MVRKLELDSLRADASSVVALLEGRSPEEDPIGWMQLSSRRRQLTDRIQALASAPDLKASVALFFAGGPVVGSRGIQADFAGKAIDVFQDLVSKRFAAVEAGSELGQRGPVAFRTSSDLLLADVVRGSVGLVLEEADRNDVITESELRVAVDQVAANIQATAAPDAGEFDELLENIDPRYLTTLGRLFELLDTSRSTLRLVEGERDTFLDLAAIRRGRERTDAARIEEREGDEFNGTLFLLPTHRRFELVDAESGTTIYGKVASEFARGRLEDLLRDGEVVGRRWRARLRVRSMLRPNAEPRVSYVLLGLVVALD